MSHTRCLHTLKIGEQGYVQKLCCEGGIRRRLLDIGLIEGTMVTCVGRSPSGDPIAYRIRGAVIAIRNADAANILIC